MSTKEPEHKFNEELIKIYGRSAKGNFGIVDTWPEKHAYCIGSRHVQYSEGMYLDIPGAEKKGAVCCTCEAAYKRRDTDKIMTWDEHKSGLLVQCLVQPTNDNSEGKELQVYLKKCIKIKHFIKEGYIGFVLLANFKK